MTDEQEPEDNPYSWQDATWTVTSPGSFTATTNGTSTTFFFNTPSSPILFMRWIAETKELQEKFYKEGLNKLPQAELEDWMRVNAFAAEDELHEAMDEISWKPWAKSEFFHREAFIGEIVDALHFIANMLVAADCTDGELNAAYLEKMERNRQRQLEGYTGLDKCSKCGRAADDVKAHGGYMKEWDGTQETYDRSTPVEDRWVNPKLKGYGCNKCFGVDGDEYK